jgi:catechol 2,3-dioxygenase-like lactoylglutathione lyase family enzyme
MIGYTTIGSNDLERAKTFYDKVLAPLGGKRIFANERLQFYGGANSGMFAVGQPYDGQPATVGNGSMFGLPAPSREVVDQVHATALEAGGTCEGTPGMRTDTFYGAYFRDPDGNKLCVFNMGR